VFTIDWPGSFLIIVASSHRKQKDGGCTFYHNTLRTKLSAIGIWKVWFNGSRSYTNSIALVEFEGLTIFLCVFIRSFTVFVRKALQVNVPVAIFFLVVD